LIIHQFKYAALLYIRDIGFLLRQFNIIILWVRQLNIIILWVRQFNTIILWVR
jgi:hypothetical protein